MQKTYDEKMLWGNVCEIIKGFKLGLESDDNELKHLSLCVLLGHFMLLVKELDLLPETSRSIHNSKVILQQLCSEHL